MIKTLYKKLNKISTFPDRFFAVKCSYPEYAFIGFTGLLVVGI
ncbi:MULTISPECIES: hypothetical protein [unclassified Gilliamella]|nr:MULTISPECIES: hypothetical protein [unclassified Gilliamella]